MIIYRSIRWVSSSPSLSYRRAVNKQKEECQKCLQLAVIGSPNVGKSLLTNNIVRSPLSAVSSKMDTTIKNIDVSICDADTQLVLVDSPGAVSISHVKEKMKDRGDSRNVLSDTEIALQKAQHILVVQDCTAPGRYLHHRVMHMLHRYSHVPSTLVMNKVDLVPDRTQLLPLVEELTTGRVDGSSIQTKSAIIGRLGQHLSTPKTSQVRDEKWNTLYRNLLQKPTFKCTFSETKRLFRDVAGWSGFEQVFFVSSLTGEGVDELRTHLLNISPQGKWKYRAGVQTNRSAEQLCEESIRAAVLDLTPSDIAYNVRPVVSEWREDGEVLQVVAEIRCNKRREGVVVLGKGGSRIAEIGRRVNDHMHSLFQRQLYVRLIVTSDGKVVSPK